MVGKLRQASKIKNDDESKINFNVEVDKFSVKLHKQQYDDICRLAEVASDYSKFQMLYHATKRFKHMRPMYSINSGFKQNLLQDDHISNENAVLWWKYAIKCVIKLRHERQGYLNAFKIPQNQMRCYEGIFMKQFQKYLDNEHYNKNELHHIITAVDQKDLEKWVTVITKKRIDNAAKKESEGGWFGFFRKRKEEETKKDDDISADEIDQVYKELYDRFLANQDPEEAKAFNNVKSINVELIVKKGGLNLLDNKTKIKLFFQDSGLKFTQFSDEAMAIEAQTKNCGLEMKSDQVFEVIEKMDESEVFWEMKYVKNPPGNEIEHAVDVRVNPIKFVYEGTFVKFIVGFFTNDTQLQIREQAAEKWADFKLGAQSQIHESIKAGRKDIHIHISSPILLIPIRQNDSDSNLWAINLGDFILRSEDIEDE